MDQDSPNQWWIMFIKSFIYSTASPFVVYKDQMKWPTVSLVRKENSHLESKGRLYINMDKWRHLSFSDILASWLRAERGPKKWNVCSVISPMIDLSVSFKTWAICCRKWGNAVARYVLFCNRVDRVIARRTERTFHPIKCVLHAHYFSGVNVILSFFFPVPPATRGPKTDLILLKYRQTNKICWWNGMSSDKLFNNC